MIRVRVGLGLVQMMKMEMEGAAGHSGSLMNKMTVQQWVVIDHMVL